MVTFGRFESKERDLRVSRSSTSSSSSGGVLLQELEKHRRISRMRTERDTGLFFKQFQRRISSSTPSTTAASVPHKMDYCSDDSNDSFNTAVHPSSDTTWTEDDARCSLSETDDFRVTRHTGIFWQISFYCY